MEAVARYVREYGAQKIVVGYPLRLDGTAGIQCEKVDRFIGQLEPVFSIPIIRWDETLTTKEAEEILRAVNIRAKKKKAAIDKTAAGVILQGYLDSQVGKNL